jgi:hypothetical protein
VYGLDFALLVPDLPGAGGLVPDLCVAVLVGEQVFHFEAGCRYHVLSPTASVAVDKRPAIIALRDAQAWVPVAATLAVSEDRTPSLVAGTVLLDALKSLQHTIHGLHVVSLRASWG